MAELTFELPIPNPETGEQTTKKTITVDDNTEALVLSNRELVRVLGRLAVAAGRIK
jgi:hypothetical protein